MNSSSAMVPFNLQLLRLTPAQVAAMRPVTSMDYYETVGGVFHDDGLFSIGIFGRVGSDERDQRFSYIDLHTTIFHPVIYRILIQLKGLYQGIMASTVYAVWDESLKDFVASNELQGQTGYSFFVKHWHQIDFRHNKSPLRDVRLKVLNKYRSIAMVDKVLVLPAGLRDLEVGDDGRPVVGEVNAFYHKLLAVARTVADSKPNSESKTLDLPRSMMQESFNEIFEFFKSMLEGKKGFLQNRWGARRITSGTRNVISAMNGSNAVLGGAVGPKYTDTIVGLYQLAQSLQPITLYKLRSGYLDNVFNVGGGKARLVDPKTLEAVLVDLDPHTFDAWFTNEGLEKFLNSYQEISTRKRPIMVDGYYLALIYRGPDHTFRVFWDIRELPAHLKKSDVHPITPIELLYLSGYQDWNHYYGFVTRYPITGTGSTYPSTAYVKTTTIGEVRRELDAEWKPYEGHTHVALEFPKADVNTYVDSLILSPTRIAGLGADYDGDTASWNAVMTDEAIATCKKYLNSKNAYLDPRGYLRASSSTFTAELVLKSMTA